MSIKEFWDSRYRSNDIGWDVGEITTPLKAYFDQLTDKSLNILIPGSGNSYEAEYLHKLGFTNVLVIDISPRAISGFKNRVPGFPDTNCINMDFFELEGKFDLIVEQTFFCAIDKSLRSDYAKQASKLLKPTGKLVGLLFDDPLYEDHPPYGGSAEEYKNYFSPYFDIEVMDRAYNSVDPRAGRELFIKMINRPKS